jgi:hypothetical protein
MREMSRESLGDKPEKLTPSSHTAVVKVGSPWKRPRSVDKADVETQGLTNSRTSCG